MLQIYPYRWFFQFPDFKVPWLSWCHNVSLILLQPHDPGFNWDISTDHNCHLSKCQSLAQCPCPFWAPSGQPSPGLSLPTSGLYLTDSATFSLSSSLTLFLTFLFYQLGLLVYHLFKRLNCLACSPFIVLTWQNPNLGSVKINTNLMLILFQLNKFRGKHWLVLLQIYDHDIQEESQKPYYIS